MSGNVIRFPERPRCQLCSAATSADSRLCSECRKLWQEDSDGTFFARSEEPRYAEIERRRWQALAEALEQGTINLARFSRIE